MPIFRMPVVLHANYPHANCPHANCPSIDKTPQQVLRDSCSAILQAFAAIFDAEGGYNE